MSNTSPRGPVQLHAHSAAARNQYTAQLFSITHKAPCHEWKPGIQWQPGNSMETGNSMEPGNSNAPTISTKMLRSPTGGSLPYSPSSSGLPTAAAVLICAVSCMGQGGSSFLTPGFQHRCITGAPFKAQRHCPRHQLRRGAPPAAHVNVLHMRKAASGRCRLHHAFRPPFDMQLQDKDAAAVQFFECYTILSDAEPSTAFNESSPYMLSGPVQLARQVAEDGEVRVQVVRQQVNLLRCGTMAVGNQNLICRNARVLRSRRHHARTRKKP